MFRHGDLTCRWLGYATARVSDGSTTVYTDPGRYGVLAGEWEPPTPDAADHHPSGPPYDARDGDVVLVTHDHHYDPDGVERVASEDATLVVHEAVDAARAGREPGPEALPYETVRLPEGDSTTVDGVAVESVPAYNRGPSPTHPRGFGVGFRFVLDGTPVFWTGDSDHVPEQDDLDVSLLLPTICGTVAMDAAGALDLAAALSPDLVCPIHYNTIDLLTADSGAFVAGCEERGLSVVLDEGWG